MGADVVGRSRSERFHAAERRIGRVTHALDELVAVPGTSMRVGLDPIVGLIPVVGDAVAAAVGLWVIAEAAHFGIPRIVLARMSVNLIVDLAIGAIPILGDVADVALRSNSRNLALFRRHALESGASTGRERAFFIGLALLLIGAVWLLIMAVGAIFGALGTVVG